MIQISLVARIAGDKNSFLDLVYVAYKLKEDGIADFNITFVGDIQNTSIYQTIVRMADLMGVSSNINFTKRSIRYNDMPQQIKDGYFFNFTVGDFTGYSGIESIRQGFKTIFCNCDKHLANEVTGYINVCRDIPAVIDLVKLIHTDAEAINRQILQNNLLMKKEYSLNEDEKAALLTTMQPKKV